MAEASSAPQDCDGGVAVELASGVPAGMKPPAPPPPPVPPKLMFEESVGESYGCAAPSAKLRMVNCGVPVPFTTALKVKVVQGVCVITGGANWFGSAGGGGVVSIEPHSQPELSGAGRVLPVGPEFST